MIVLKSDSNSIAIAAKELVAGKVIVVPTDTVYGFSGIIPCSESRIRGIKGRDEGKPFIRLVSSPQAILSYSDTPIPPKLLEMMPAPLTIVVKLKAEHAVFSGQTAGFRCPDDSWLCAVIDACGSPIYSTSVNRTGFPLLNSVAEIEKEFGNEVSLIVKDENITKDKTVPSTIVEIVQGKCKILRQGKISIPKDLLLCPCD